MKEQLVIIYVGSLNPESNSYKRFKTLEALGHTAIGIDIDPFILGSIFTKLHYHLNIGPGITALNKKLKLAVKETPADLLLIDNRTYISPSTFRKIKQWQPALKIANLITDDPFGRYSSGWRFSLQAAPFYDIHFVQRIENVEELKQQGARRVELCYRSYDPSFHKPMQLSAQDAATYKCKVGFVGTHEETRELFVKFLIDNGIPVKVTGNDWPKGKYWNTIEPHYAAPSVYGEDYIKTINGMDIALHFLRKSNRDQQDSRTFEIPACGVFMLAERSPLHETFFKDNMEAVFFDTENELLEKVKYYLTHNDERQQIAANGLQRCIDSCYDHRGRLELVLKQIFNQN